MSPYRADIIETISILNERDKHTGSIRIYATSHIVFILQFDT